MSNRRKREFESHQNVFDGFFNTQISFGHDEEDEGVDAKGHSLGHELGEVNHANSLLSPQSLVVIFSVIF